MNEVEKTILENQKVILRCFLYLGETIIKEDINQRVQETNKILFPEEEQSLQSKTENALRGNSE